MPPPTPCRQALRELDFALSQLENYLNSFAINKSQGQKFFNYHLAIKELTSLLRSCLERLKAG